MVQREKERILIELPDRLSGILLDIQTDDGDAITIKALLENLFKAVDAMKAADEAKEAGMGTSQSHLAVQAANLLKSALESLERATLALEAEALSAQVFNRTIAERSARISESQARTNRHLAKLGITVD